MRAYLEDIAPLNHAAEIRKPLGLVVGKKDPRVPFAEAEQMERAAQDNGIPVWFLMAENEGHGFAIKRNNDFLFYTIVNFVQRFLL